MPTALRSWRGLSLIFAFICLFCGVCRRQNLRERLRGGEKTGKSDVAEPNQNPLDEQTSGPRGLLRPNRAAERKKAAEANPEGKLENKSERKSAHKPDADSEDDSPAAKTL